MINVILVIPLFYIAMDWKKLPLTGVLCISMLWQITGSLDYFVKFR